VLGCLYLFASLPAKTLLWCLAWNLIGILIYLGYARRHSALATPEQEAGGAAG
jgi:APA family basic amino acid/polyamine antiporter